MLAAQRRFSLATTTTKKPWRPRKLSAGRGPRTSALLQADVGHTTTAYESAVLEGEAEGADLASSSELGHGRRFASSTSTRRSNSPPGKHPLINNIPRWLSDPDSLTLRMKRRAEQAPSHEAETP